MPCTEGPVYVRHMGKLLCIFNVLGWFAHLARALCTNGAHYIAVCARTQAAFTAKNLFLRKQLAFYRERKSHRARSRPYQEIQIR